MKFFRNIRQSLLAQSCVTSYLTCAISEIVLLVIGILISLHWSELQKQSKLECNYNYRLLNDGSADEDQMDYLLDLAQNRLEAYNQTGMLLIDDHVNNGEFGNQISLSTRAIYSDFQPNNSAYEDLKSRANLKFISDKSILKALNHYFNRVEELKSIIMVNGIYTVHIYFGYDENCANGSYQSSLEEGQFSIGLDQDLKDAIECGRLDILSIPMKTRLLNESLEYVSVNTRQSELYEYMHTEFNTLEERQALKCNQSSQQPHIKSYMHLDPIKNII